MTRLALVSDVRALLRLLLPAGWGVVFAAISAFGQPFEIDADQQRVTISAAQGPVFAYRFHGMPAKPYVEKLYTPGGRNILRDAPHDHLHHHGLMFAVSVDGLSFWEEKEGSGQQRHRRFDHLPAAVPSGLPSGQGGTSGAALVEDLQWVHPQTEEVLLAETRSITVCPVDQPAATLLTWETRLTAPAGSRRELTGAHYYGLGMRFVDTMDHDGRVIHGEGEPGEVVRGSERLVETKWVAYTALVDGRPVTAALFDHPQNVRHPSRMFTMTAPFAYLSATMNLWKEPLGLEPGQTLRLRYGVAACDGHLAAADLDRLYAAWLRQTAAGDGPVQSPED